MNIRTEATVWRPHFVSAFKNFLIENTTSGRFYWRVKSYRYNPSFGQPKRVSTVKFPLDIYFAFWEFDSTPWERLTATKSPPNFDSRNKTEWRGDETTRNLREAVLVLGYIEKFHR